MRSRWVVFLAPLLWVSVGRLAAQTPGIAPPRGETRTDAVALRWNSPARLRHFGRSTKGTLIFGETGVVFRPAKGATLRWPFAEIQTFDLLTPRRLVLRDYQNRSWHRHGERSFWFDLGTPMPPAVAAALASRVGKPARNGDPDPAAPSFAAIPARHRTFWGGTNGTLLFGAGGIEYATTTGEGGRSWRWSDIDTLANPDPYHFTLTGYRETFDFELKEPMAGPLFDRLWDYVYARDLKSTARAGEGQNQ
ncbi:MAG TPA: hypothetical protein VGS20_00100 [Candidatus Acidoferrales bacterium]|nr:hypothetical protein [Candidatus Acidoferrales bacterium]